MKIKVIGKVILGGLLALTLTADPVFAKPSAKKTIRALVTKGGILKKLPLAGRAVAKKKSSTVSSLTVSGTPPLLSGLPEQSLKNVFWEAGLVDDMNDGNPSENACNTFNGGSQDGQSAGLGACYLAQNVGFSFETILSSATSFCYMQKMQTAPDGVTVSGAATVAAALTPPSGNAIKLTKVVVTGFPGEGSSEIFIELPGKGQNIINGNIYKHTLYFCDGETTPGSLERATIKNNLDYLMETLGNEDGSEFFSNISSKITVDSNGKLIFNPNAARDVDISFIQGGDSFFKGNLIIANNKIKNKTFDSFGDSQRKAYTVAKYTGNSIQTLRFTEGATKDDNFSVITEYRDSFYAAAPNNAEFNADLAAVDLESDTFYVSAPTIDVSELSDFDCDTAVAGATITMDFSNPALVEFTASCEQNRLEGMNFCRNDSEVNTAHFNSATQCFNP